MAIRVRKGLEEAFIPSKLLPGEFAVATDTGNAWYCFTAGQVKKIATAFDIESILNEYSDYQEAQKVITDRLQQAINTNTAGIVADGTEILANQNDITSIKAQLRVTNQDVARMKDEILGQIDQDLDSMESKLNTMENDVTSMKLILDGKADGAYVEDGYLYLTANNEIVSGPLGPFSGSGGGGGSSNNAVLTIANASGWLSKSIASGSDCEISITWSSLEDEIPTGNGTLKVTVNGQVKRTSDVIQGTIKFNVGSYLSTGTNVVKVNISDVYGNSRTINYSVSVVEVSISSTFDASMPYSGSIGYTYAPVGNVDKTIHFILDGGEIGTAQVSASGRQQSFIIPTQAHGRHTFLVYFTATVDAVEIKSNELYYELICTEEGNDNPIIVSTYRNLTAEQYASIVVPYMVYNPLSMASEITLLANDKVVSNLTVDRTQQVWTYRADTVGNLQLKITCGTTTRTLNLEITESSINIGAETQDLSLYLSSYGRSNNEDNPGIWGYEDINAVFTGFNFASDGWQMDKDNNTVLRVSGDARLTIPYHAFAQDFRISGKTIELEFATRDVMNYDATILSCMSGERGFQITAQKAMLKSEQSEISTQYKDGHVRITFVVEKRAQNRLLYIYINGIMSGTVQYPVDDDFSQAHPVDITIGSNDCTIDVYNIRVYDNNLTRFQILDNWIADTQDVNAMLERYSHNNVFDAYGNIVIGQLPKDLPYMVMEGAELPQYKGDKKTITGYFVDPQNPERNFTFENAQSDVQGTSSQYYARKNYKIKFNGGFILADETTAKNYAMNDDAIPTNTFTFKADVASSEGANNVELVKLYNLADPYKTPPQKADTKARQGIDGFPIVMFWNDGNMTTFLGKYNFNNDKGTPEVFGFTDVDQSWEVLNNTSDRVLFKSADFTGEDWLNDFEARQPEDYTDPTELSKLSTWLVSTDQTKATGSTLAAPVTYGDTEYTSDTAAYRLAKFKSELPDYMEVDSTCFYYLFTELFLMVDSRAKNMFLTKFGGETNE